MVGRTVWHLQEGLCVYHRDGVCRYVNKRCSTHLCTTVQKHPTTQRSTHKHTQPASITCHGGCPMVYSITRNTPSNERLSNITVIRKSFQSWMLMVAVIFQKRLQETVQDFFNPRLNQKATTLWQRLQLFYSERRPWTM
jgi:hypothetical protein